MKLSQEENGEVESWDTTLSGHNFFETYIRNYVKWMDEYTSAELKQKVKRKVLNGNNYGGTTYNGNTSAHFTLINGSMVSMNLNSVGDSGLWIGIDVNGLSQPNTVGKDTFLFFLSPEYGLRPLGDLGTPATWSFGTYSRSVVKGTSGNACNKKATGYWCSALIMQDSWVIENDYPWN